MITTEKKREHLSKHYGMASKTRYSVVDKEYTAWISYILAPGIPPQALYFRDERLSNVEEWLENQINILYENFTRNGNTD